MCGWGTPNGLERYVERDPEKVVVPASKAGPPYRPRHFSWGDFASGSDDLNETRSSRVNVVISANQDTAVAYVGDIRVNVNEPTASSVRHVD